MKKSLLLFVPLMALLTACDGFTVDHTNEKHSAGPDKSISANQGNATSYTYFSGDVFETDDMSKASFTFSYEKTTSNLEKDDFANLISCDNSSVQFVIEDASNVGTKEGIGLFVGADSSYVDGHFTILLDKAIKGVNIKARRYYATTNAWNEDTVVVDSEVGIAINDTRYIKLTGEKDSDNVPKVTECRYYLNENKNQITIKVGPKRAFIEEIVFYY